MHTETIEYRGYKIKIAQDEGPENPFEAWDCEPPLLTFYGGRHSYAKAYNDAPENWYEVLKLIPDSFFQRGERVKMIREFLTCSMREFAKVLRYNGSWSECGSVAELKDAFQACLEDQCGAKPEGWGSACDWFETAEALLNYGGIPCLYEQSNGYCQGDTTLCLVVLTPEWYEKTGAPKENAQKDCQGAIELYSAWAWGDVYGVSEILAPGPLDEDGDETEGEELDDGSCWGFYGYDHEKSGLMEHARETIDCHIEEQAKEAHALESALCSAD